MTGQLKHYFIGICGCIISVVLYVNWKGYDVFGLSAPLLSFLLGGFLSGYIGKRLETRFSSKIPNFLFYIFTGILFFIFPPTFLILYLILFY